MIEPGHPQYQRLTLHGQSISLYYSCSVDLSRKVYNFRAITVLLFLVEISNDTLYSASKIYWDHHIMDKDNNIDLLKVIADFLELGHVENIVAMFKQDTDLYALTGKLIRDERFNVRLGTAVLFEELAQIRREDISLAIPFLLPLLQKKNPVLRGESATILGIINTPDTLQHLRTLADDPDPQVREIVTDILDTRLDGL